MRPIDKIVVHHSASARATTVEQIASWHKAKGWKGVGYHFVILWNGSIAQGRPVSGIGAHAQGHNLKSIGICVVGDNTKPESAWTDEQVTCLRALVQTLCILFPNAVLFGHRDLPGAKTLCPGLDLRALLARGTDSWTVHKSLES